MNKISSKKKKALNTNELNIVTGGESGTPIKTGESNTLNLTLQLPK